MLRAHVLAGRASQDCDVIQDSCDPRRQECPEIIASSAARERNLEPDQSDIANSENLGVVLCTRGDYEACLPHFERCLAVRVKTLGADHADTARIGEYLGFSMRAQGRYGEAESHYLRALISRTKCLGPAHPDTIRSVYHLRLLRQLTFDAIG